MSLRSWKSPSSSGNKDGNSKPKNPKDIAEQWERSRLYLVTVKTTNNGDLLYYCSGFFFTFVLCFVSLFVGDEDLRLWPILLNV